MATRSLLAVPVIAAAVGACAYAGAPRAHPGELVEVTVHNLSGDDVTVYLQSSSGSLVRLGVAQLGEPTVFRKRIPVDSDLFFVLDPVGHFGKVAVAGRIPRADATLGLRLTISRDLALSTWTTNLGGRR